MAKGKTAQTQPNAEKPIKITPSSAVPAADPGQSEVENIRLAFGEVLIAALDENGNEGIPFKVSQSTYNRYYNTEKFILKKT